MPKCLRDDCEEPTTLGSPACRAHWQQWRDEEQERIAIEWNLDLAGSEFEAEKNWLRERRQRGMA